VFLSSNVDLGEERYRARLVALGPRLQVRAKSLQAKAALTAESLRASYMQQPSLLERIIRNKEAGPHSYSYKDLV
jgi:hypothetical protein